MAIYVYNTKQQALKAQKIAELFSFASNDFCGLVSNIANPIIFNTGNQDSWYWNTSLQEGMIKFVAGGINIDYDVPASPTPAGATDVYPKVFTQSAEKCYMYGLDVTVPSDNSTIETDNYSGAKIIQVECENIAPTDLYIVVTYPVANPAAANYYEYSEGQYSETEDTSLVQGKVYYYRLENESFVVTNAVFGEGLTRSFEYYGNTPWITGTRFFIPFCYIDKQGNTHQMIFNRDKTHYESFLSARTYYNLLNELGNQFVFRVGGPTLGDIGNLNVTNSTISNRLNSGEGVTIDGAFRLDNDNVVRVINDTNVDNVLLLDDGGRVYRAAEQYTVPIKHGGTQAQKIDGARTNLGFTYGTGNPSGTPSRRNPDGTSETDIGAVYFKLL